MQHLRYAPTLRLLCKRQFGREEAEFLCLFDSLASAFSDAVLERFVQVLELDNQIARLVLAPPRT
jgi:hypothetical protein